ncbi:MAG: zinc-binding dehydrogenase [Acidobacteria bacterium]|nr:zinc-binding dehydrogenase [Acidobacteriota bacterium]
MKTTAAILVDLGQPLRVVELEVPALRAGQVLVQIAFSGVCHTQVLEVRGYRGADRFLPHCLGHEGSGLVLDVGPGVTKVKQGDHVVLSWIRGSGADIPGTVYGWAGRGVNAGGVTTFSRHAVVSENRLTLMPDGLGPETAALLGCAVATGMGAVFNTACPRPGQSLVVFGAGGVGLCAVAAAATAGCMPVVAVDVLPQKLETAVHLGATHTLLATDSVDLLAEVTRICCGAPDFAIEATGRPAIMLAALQCVRSQGGTAVVVGNARYGETLTIDPMLLNAGKRLLGTWGGDTIPDRDFPRFAKILALNRFDLGTLQSAPYSLSDANRAIEDLEQGNAIRPLIDPARE